MSTEQIQKQRPEQEGLSFDPDQLDCVNDWMTCQKEDQGSEMHSSESSLDARVPLEIFRSALNCHRDPMSPVILSSTESLLPYLTVNRVDMTEKYCSLVALTGDDFSHIKDVLVAASKSSVDALYWSINSALVSYQSALAKNASTAVGDISNAAKSLLAMLEQSHRQHTSLQKSVEDLADTWNTMSTSMSNYMREFDTHRVQDTIPKAVTSAAASAAPSVDSQARSVRQIPAATGSIPRKSSSSASSFHMIDDFGSTSSSASMDE